MNNSVYPDWKTGFYKGMKDSSMAMMPHINILWVADFYTLDDQPLLNPRTGNILYIPIIDIQKRVSGLEFTPLDICGYRVPIPDSLSLNEDMQINFWDNDAGDIESYMNFIGLSRSYAKVGQNTGMLKLKITNLATDTHESKRTQTYLVSPTGQMSSTLTSSNDAQIKELMQTFIVHNSLQLKGYNPGFIAGMNTNSVA